MESSHRREHTFFGPKKGTPDRLSFSGVELSISMIILRVTFVLGLAQGMLAGLRD